jgi:hypothetical protein
MKFSIYIFNIHCMGAFMAFVSFRCVLRQLIVVGRTALSLAYVNVLPSFVHQDESNLFYQAVTVNQPH